MTASLGLLCVAAAILTVGPRLASAVWVVRAPRVAIFAWQAMTVSVVAAVVLAGVTSLIPITALAGDLGTIIHACAVSVGSSYGSSQFLPGKLLGALLAGGIPLWVGFTGARVVLGGLRARHRLRRSLRLVAEEDLRLGVRVLDSPAPAAFCVPGRGAQVVVTRGALEHLSREELRGVLAHEAAHLRGRHDLAVALSHVLARAFPGVRLFEVATVATRGLVELLADDAALRRVDRVDLASAIVRLAEMKAPAAAMTMAEHAAVQRVSRLLAPQPPLEPWRYGAAAVAAMTVVLAPLLIAGYPAMCAALSDLCSFP